MDWIVMKAMKEELDSSIIPFDELAALAGGISAYIQIKPDQKEFLEAAIEKLKRQRQAAMNIISLGSLVNSNIKDCILTKKEIEGISKAFTLHKVMVDNVEWGGRASRVTDNLSNMNKCFKNMVRGLVEEELSDPDDVDGAPEGNV